MSISSQVFNATCFVFFIWTVVLLSHLLAVCPLALNIRPDSLIYFTALLCYQPTFITFSFEKEQYLPEDACIIMQIADLYLTCILVSVSVWKVTNRLWSCNILYALTALWGVKTVVLLAPCHLEDVIYSWQKLCVPVHLLACACGCLISLWLMKDKIFPSPPSLWTCAWCLITVFRALVTVSYRT